MKNWIKLNIILIIVILFQTKWCYANQLLNIKEKSNIISGGSILKEYEILTTDGFVEAQVLEINISDQYTKLGVLTSIDGVKKLASTSAMTTDNKAVAGINGDFFAGSKGIGNSVGLAINGGKLISSSAEENKGKDVFTSFLIDEDDNIFMQYIKDEITINIKNGKNIIQIPARYINKYTHFLLYKIYF